MKILAKVVFACAAFVAAIQFIGCSDDPTTTDNSPKRTIPKAGSSYTYVRTEKTPANVVISGSDSIHVVTSIGNFAPFQGKDSVISFVDVNTQNTTATPDTMTIAYEGNGDISIYRGNGFEGLPPGVSLDIIKWWRLPFKSKADVLIIDTTVNLSFTIGAISVSITKVNGVATGSATTENVSINGTVYICDRADVTFTIIGSASGFPATLVFHTKYLFNEELGYFMFFDTDNNLGLAANFIDPDNNLQVLTSFNVKK
jgi:hypothetical protein